MTSSCERFVLLDIYSGKPINSPLAVVYMCQWAGSALVQLMACRLFGAKLLLEPCWLIGNWTLMNKFQWNSNQNTNLFIHQNAFKNVVCEMAAILSRGNKLSGKCFHVSLSSWYDVCRIIRNICTQFVLLFMVTICCGFCSDEVIPSNMA